MTRSTRVIVLVFLFMFTAIFHFFQISEASVDGTLGQIPGIEIATALDQENPAEVAFYQEGSKVKKVGEFFVEEREGYPVLILRGTVTPLSPQTPAQVNCNLAKSFANNFLRIETSEGITVETLGTHGNFTDVNIVFTDYPIDRPFEIRVVYPKSNVSAQPSGDFDIYDKGWDFDNFVNTDYDSASSEAERAALDVLYQVSADAENMSELLSYMDELAYTDRDESEGVGRKVTTVVSEHEGNCLDAGIVAAALLELEYGIEARPVVTFAINGNENKSHLELEIQATDGQWITFDPRLSTDGVLRASISAPLHTKTPVERWNAYVLGGQVFPGANNGDVQICTDEIDVELISSETTSSAGVGELA